jgi:two-component system CheB/CheR fusion protein
LFQALRKASGLDFSQYKMGTIQRRVQRRMVLHKMEGLVDYIAFARNNPEELRSLEKDLLINVTQFFRDSEAFEALKTVAIPALLKDRHPNDPIRVWVPGCATGEEVYSLAICLLESLGEHAGITPIMMFGMDVSDAAIDKARAGRYVENIVADVSPERLNRFFTRIDGGYQISRTVRELCVFAHQDITRHPPISGMDLISCRNVLIYLSPSLQKRILPLFHYSLKEGGFLFLGGSETVGSFTELFAPVDEKHKIYRRRNAPSPLVFDFTVREPVALEVPRVKSEPQILAPFDIQREADRLVLSKYGPPGVVINDNLEIIQFRGQTGSYLEPAPGVPSLNILKMAREGLLPDLQTAIDQVRKTDVPAQKETLLRMFDTYRRVNVEVSPLTIPPALSRYYVVLFSDVPSSGVGTEKTASEIPAITSEQSSQEQVINQLRKELSTTRGHLQSIIEELEASNEALKAANEEVMSSNEELQSINEELKAANEEVVSSNEELQSTNEELQSAKEELRAANEELTKINDELKKRNEDSKRLTDDLTNLFGSVNVAILMLEQNLSIRLFNPQASKLFNLIPTDVGRPISDLKPRLLVPDLDQLATEVLETFAHSERDVQHQDGRWYHLSVRPYRTKDNKIDGVVVTVVDVDTIKRSEQQRAEAERRLRTLVETAADGIVTIDEKGTIQSFNAAAEHLFGYTVAEVVGRNVKMLMPPPH